MHRYEELEKLYYKKKFTEYGTLGFFIIVLFVILYVLYFNFEKSDSGSGIVKSGQKELKKKLSNNETDKVVELKKELKSDVEVKVKKLVLYPIYPDIHSLLNFKKAKEEDKKLSQNSEKLKEENIVTEKIDVTEENKEEEKKSKIVVKPVNRIKSRFMIKTKEENLTTLIEAYKHSPNYEKGIKVVELYFKEKKYKESLEWSKKVNKLNPEDYKSWYFFAKNLIELGDKEKAKKVLIIYLDNYGKNEKIEKLLRSIK